MPDLNFRVTAVEPASRGLAPLLCFKLEVTNTPATQRIHSAMLQAQIQLEPARRNYDAGEKERLRDLFGEPERWGQTLRPRLWAHAGTTLPAFTGTVEASLTIPCTYDMDIGATKYFYALENGEAPLLFLFSGTVFYAADDGRLQAAQISWDKECAFRLPAAVWRAMMDFHYPNSAWLSLPRDAFDRLYAFKRESGLATWEQVIDRLLLQKGAGALPVTSAHP